MNTPQQHVAEAVGSTVGGKVSFGMTQGGAIVGILGSLTMNELAMIGGLLVSVVGLAANLAITWHWKARHYRLEAERLEWDQRRHERREAERRGQEFDDE